MAPRNAVWLLRRDGRVSSPMIECLGPAVIPISHILLPCSFLRWLGTEFMSDERGGSDGKNLGVLAGGIATPSPSLVALLVFRLGDILRLFLLLGTEGSKHHLALSSFDMPCHFSATRFMHSWCTRPGACRRICGTISLTKKLKAEIRRPNCLRCSPRTSTMGPRSSSSWLQERAAGSVAACKCGINVGAKP